MNKKKTKMKKNEKNSSHWNSNAVEAQGDRANRLTNQQCRQMNFLI